MVRQTVDTRIKHQTAFQQTFNALKYSSAYFHFPPVVLVLNCARNSPLSILRRNGGMAAIGRSQLYSLVDYNTRRYHRRKKMSGNSEMQAIFQNYCLCAVRTLKRVLPTFCSQVLAVTLKNAKYLCGKSTQSTYTHATYMTTLKKQ